MIPGILRVAPFCILVNSAWAGLSVAPLFQDGAVLQRQAPVPVWGKADPGASVKVTFGGQSKEAKADAGGRWSVTLDAMEASAEGRSLTVGADGAPAIECKDVLVGEVWLASGQSNMQWSISQARPEDQASAAQGPIPLLRFFQVPQSLSFERLEGVKANWQPTSPETVKKFSAVAYFFGRKLTEEIKVPVGIINSSWGGSRIEPWWAEEGLEGIPELAKTREERRARSPGFPEYEETNRRYIRSVRAWADNAEKAVSAGAAAPAMPPPPPLLAKGHNQQVGTYQAMIHPLVPYALRGFIWYQGESNNGEGMAYTAKMQALIQGWRQQFRCPKAPFYFVQLAPFRYGDKPAEALPGIWKAQQAALAIPHTGMACTMDIGNPKDIHPSNKSEVGNRLALWALADTYGKPGIVKSGPLFTSFSVDGGRISIQFGHTGTGLTTRDGQTPGCFEIAGADGKFQPAIAAISPDGKSVELSNTAITAPVQARFCWTDTAQPNLMNKEGLPAAAFHTHWPEVPKSNP